MFKLFENGEKATVNNAFDRTRPVLRQTRGLLADLRGSSPR
jgi:hypothetical protein